MKRRSTASELEKRLVTIADYCDYESGVLLDRVHGGNNLSFAELTDLAYMLQGVSVFARALDVEPQSYKAPPRLSVINGGRQ